jgi:hypothetical protein
VSGLTLFLGVIEMLENRLCMCMCGSAPGNVQANTLRFYQQSERHSSSMSLHQFAACLPDLQGHSASL